MSGSEPSIFRPNVIYFQTLQTANLPTRLKVRRGSCGINEDEHIDVYFAKYTKMIEIISSSGKRYVVPVSSSLKCCTLYNPEYDIHRALRGYKFESTAQLVNTTPLPVTVCVENGFCHEKTKTDIEADDVLILSGKNSQGEIVCIDASNFTTKNISDEFDCSYNTCPSSLFIPLSQFITRVEIPVAVTFEVLLKNGKKDMFTITNVFTATSIIGRLFKHSEENEDAFKMVEVFLDVPLKVEVMNLSHEAMTRLKKNTAIAYNCFNPTTIATKAAPKIERTIIINTFTYDDNDTQRLFLNCMSSVNDENSLVHILPPNL